MEEKKNKNMEIMYYTFDEVCQLYRIHRNTLRRWIRHGTIPGEKIEGVWRFSRADIDRKIDLTVE
jgi:excisionase family DNA binding protein